MARAAAPLFLLFVAACTVRPPGDAPVAVVRGPVPLRASSPMSEALVCLSRNLPAGADLRLAVHSIPDRTGVQDYDGPGRYVTQAAELMMITALARAGVRQVNRTAVAVVEWELEQALAQRLGEGREVVIEERAYPFRPIRLGQLLGSTHTIYGAITELDFDLVSDGAEVSIGGLGGRGRGYYVSVGMDVVVADTRTTEITLARSYRKQIWGQELEANLFRFFDINPAGGGLGPGAIGVELFDIRLGRQQNEPLHASLRWVVELAAYEIVRDLYGVGGACDALVPALSRTPPMRLEAGRLQPLPALAPAEIAPEAGPAGGASPTPPAAGSMPPKEPIRLPGGQILPESTEP